MSLHRTTVAVLAMVGVLAMAAPASAGPILISAGPNSGAGLPGDLALSDGSSVILPFSGQLMSATLVLSSSNAVALGLGAFTAEVNGIAIGQAFRSLQDPNWSFALTGQMLAAANQAGFVDVRFDFAGAYNTLRFDSLALNGQTNGNSVVPEPSTFVLMSLGLVGAATLARRRRRS